MEDYFDRIGSTMAPEAQRDLTAMLAAWSSGDEAALKSLVTLVYPEIRRIARQHLGRHPSEHSLESAAIANEAYLKLVRSGGVPCENRAHFFALCAQIIRRILVDHERKARYQKRGGDAVRVPLNEVLLGARARGVELLALDEALGALSKLDPRKGQVVELRYFGGLSVDETAQVLRISAETVLRDWRFAKSWLLRELRRRPDGVSGGTRRS